MALNCIQKFDSCSYSNNKDKFEQFRWPTQRSEDDVFCLSYNILNELWHRTLLVMVFRNEARLYSLHVGATADPDGKAARPLNLIISIL